MYPPVLADAVEHGAVFLVACLAKLTAYGEHPPCVRPVSQALLKSVKPLLAQRFHGKPRALLDPLLDLCRAVRVLHAGQLAGLLDELCLVLLVEPCGVLHQCTVDQHAPVVDLLVGHVQRIVELTRLKPSHLGEYGLLRLHVTDAVPFEHFPFIRRFGRVSPPVLTGHGEIAYERLALFHLPVLQAEHLPALPE